MLASVKSRGGARGHHRFRNAESRDTVPQRRGQVPGHGCALIKERSRTMTDQTAKPAPAGSQSSAGGFSRRSLFRAAGVGAAVVGGGSFLEACSSGIKGATSSTSTSASSGSTSGATTSKEITIGWIHPITGSLSGFGYPDSWVIDQIMATSQYKNGFKIGGSTYKVNIKSYDSQSSVTMAGTLAKQAIQNDNVDLLFASSTPETVNAVASQAETLGTPLVCSNIPWESWYGNLGGNPAPGHQTFKPKWTIMYFLGAEHLVECFIPMWNRIGAQYGNNHVVAAAFPTTPTATRSGPCSRPSPRRRATPSTCHRRTPTGWATTRR